MGKACVVEEYDRAAPRGVGSVKLAGNYAPDLKPNTEAKQSGYPIGLYLDAGSRTYVEEFSTSNFVGICGETGKYVRRDRCWKILGGRGVRHGCGVDAGR